MSTLSELLDSDDDESVVAIPPPPREKYPGAPPSPTPGQSRPSRSRSRSFKLIRQPWHQEQHEDYQQGRDNSIVESDRGSSRSSRSRSSRSKSLGKGRRRGQGSTSDRSGSTRRSKSGRRRPVPRKRRFKPRYPLNGDTTSERLLAGFTCCADLTLDVFERGCGIEEEMQTINDDIGWFCYSFL